DPRDNSSAGPEGAKPIAPTAFSPSLTNISRRAAIDFLATKRLTFSSDSSVAVKPARAKAGRSSSSSAGKVVICEIAIFTNFRAFEELLILLRNTEPFDIGIGHRDRFDEQLRVRMLRVLNHTLRVTLLDYLPLIHDQYCVTDLQGS